jgi:hypothetical protein
VQQKLRLNHENAGLSATHRTDIEHVVPPLPVLMATLDHVDSLPALVVEVLVDLTRCAHIVSPQLRSDAIRVDSFQNLHVHLSCLRS